MPEAATTEKPATTTTTTAATDTGAAVSAPGATKAASDSPASAEAAGAKKADATTGDAPAAQDWRSGLEGEAKEFASRFTAPADLAKAALDLRKANSSMVRIPGEKATDEDKAKFRKAIGVPEKPEEYKPDLGRDLTDADKAVFGPIAQIMHEHAVPASAFTAVSKAVQKMAEEQDGERNRVALKARETAQAALTKEWGGDHDANLALAKREIASAKDPSLVQLLNSTDANGQKIGDHPALIKHFATVGRSRGEGDFIGAVGSTERESVQGQINKLMKDNPPGTAKYTNDVAAQVAKLHEQLHGTGPSTGGFGR